MHTPTLAVCATGALLAATAGSVALAADDAEAAAELRREIAALIGDARCNNLVNCRVLALGTRACGGPDEYVAYSVWSTSGEDVRAKAMEYNFLHEDLVARRAQAGSCEVLPEPRAACVNRRCVTVPAQ